MTATNLTRNDMFAPQGQFKKTNHPQSEDDVGLPGQGCKEADSSRREGLDGERESLAGGGGNEEPAAGYQISVKLRSRNGRKGVEGMFRDRKENGRN